MKDLGNLSINALKEHLASLKTEELYELVTLLETDPRQGVQVLGKKVRKKKEKEAAEIQRIKSLYEFDAGFGSLVAGVDEVGRGPLAGPIVAAAVILPYDGSLEKMILGLDDSKRLAPAKRRELAMRIKEEALAWAIYEHSNEDIDGLGLAYCNNNIFLGALAGLKITPATVLSDAFPLRGYQGPNKAIIGGDRQSAAIAAASILAKVYRDDLMIALAEQYPGYGFEGHVGYASSDHIAAIQKLGPCAIHRRSFLSRILEEK